jgi:hypothetical protein
MPWYQTLYPPLIVAALVSALAWYLSRPLFRPSGRIGWHEILPGGSYRFCIVAGSGFIALLAYVRLFIGSARTDGPEQMQILGWLILCFAIGVAVIVWRAIAIRRSRLRWQARTLTGLDSKGEQFTFDLADVVGMRRLWTGTVGIAFSNGQVLKLDAYATSVDALCARIIEIDEELAAGMPI